ncbi:isochorismatase family cysteine hydrolase [Domibacillus enclensis]|uniref:Isochorismatase n=1 Tax=Domibacillus enclensis TaxID=1017273 RepID=A0A1N7CZ97_9BACI|nr:isochorismatase family cysteine hydrolase [Domibacillus enclensis]OXS73115.1 isochorismatase [Domibacillus enclensis]SIR68978.1 Nicotinamidase-related amidase [Domibacillus enclensis]
MTKKCALLIIDMMNDFQFPKGEQLARYADETVPSISQLKNHFHEREWPVIYINDHYQLWKADIALILEHVTNDISDPIIQKIKPDDKDYFLIKPKHSGFYGTALNTLLHELDVKSVAITGVAGNICVFFTANDAYMREFEVYVPKDAIASEEKKYNEYALEMMERVLNADVRPVSELIQLLS